MLEELVERGAKILIALVENKSDQAYLDAEQWHQEVKRVCPGVATLTPFTPDEEEMASRWVKQIRPNWRLNMMSTQSHGDKLAEMVRDTVVQQHRIQELIMRQASQRSFAANKATQRRTRNTSKKDAAILENKIQSVLAAAQTKWPDDKDLPKTPYQAAKLLVGGDRGRQLHGYAESTIKQILNGTYPAMQSLGIPGRY